MNHIQRCGYQKAKHDSLELILSFKLLITLIKIVEGSEFHSLQELIDLAEKTLENRTLLRNDLLC